MPSVRGIREVREHRRTAGGDPEALKSAAEKKYAGPASEAEQLRGGCAQESSCGHQRAGRNSIGQHAHRNRGEQLDAERDCAKNPDESCVHRSASIGEIGKIQANEDAARSSRNPENGVGQNHERKPTAPGLQSGWLARHILRSVPDSTQSAVPSKFANLDQVVTIEDSLTVCKEMGFITSACNLLRAWRENIK